MPLPDGQGEVPGNGFRLAWEFNLAQVLQVVQVVSLLCALVYWFFINANRGIDNERRLDELQTAMAQQTGELRQTVAAGLTDMRQQLSLLPDQRARLDQAERRLTDLDTRHAGLDGRILTLERQMIELRSDLNAVTRASVVPLPGTRR
jgi:hypothetical protein